MKTSRILAIAAIALIVGFLAAHLTMGQSTNRSPTNKPAADYYFATGELESFVTYLEDTKQTNVLERFNRYLNATLVARCTADMGMNVVALHRIREGKTNEVIHLMESQVTASAVGFAASYRELPPALREKVTLTTLKMAKDYFDKYHVKRDQQSEAALAYAFKLLDENKVSQWKK